MTELEKAIREAISAEAALTSPLHYLDNKVDYWYHTGALRGLAIAMELIKGISGDSEDGQ